MLSLEFLKDFCYGRGRIVNGPPLVVVESPYAGNIDRNLEYLRDCFSECIEMGEVPIASHKLYTDVKETSDNTHRDLGLFCGYAWGTKADYVVCYTDLGVSDGMQRAIEFYSEIGKKIRMRKLGGKWS